MSVTTRRADRGSPLQPLLETGEQLAGALATLRVSKQVSASVDF